MSGKVTAPRWLVGLGLCLALTCGASFSALAATPTDDSTDDSFERRVTKSTTTTGESPGDEDEGGDEPAPKIPCTWTLTPTTDTIVGALNFVTDTLDRVQTILNGSTTAFKVEYYVIDGHLERYADANGEFERRQDANCVGATELTPDELRGYRWRATMPPEAWIMHEDVLLVVEGRLQPPQPEISPPAEAPVNLGLWLAVTDTGPVVAEGSLGPLWLRGTATLTTTTFDPGNGDAPVVCDGAGTPIADPGVVDEGPCGYTYRSSDDVNDDDLTITVTSVWEITWETSDGSSDGEAPGIMTLSSTHPYDVYEIQTVGTGN